MLRRCAALAFVAVAAIGCQRPVQVQPEVIEDARLAARVKTALVNDAQLGPRIIEVRAVRGVVSLSGIVDSAAEVNRAIDLARTVPGVTEVRSQLVVRDPSEPVAPAVQDDTFDRSLRDVDAEESAGERRLLAIGASVNARRPTDGSLASTLSVGPLVRLGVGRGLGIAVGFSWFRADLQPESSPGTLGRVTIRPVMGGLSYTFSDQTRLALSLSLVGGIAFNSFTLRGSTVRDVLALEVGNSLAMRPGVSLWFDLNGRTALNLFGGYVITRPRMTFLEDDQFARRSVRADTAVVNVGLAYKLF